MMRYIIGQSIDYSGSLFEAFMQSRAMSNNRPRHRRPGYRQKQRRKAERRTRGGGS